MTVGGPVEAVLLDMGGVLLDLGPGGALPTGQLDWRGREALARAVQERGGRVEVEALEPLLFRPWRREHERRYERGREASWAPHLARLRRHAGFRSWNVTLLRAWFRPFGEQVKAVPGAREAVATLAARGLPLALVSNVPLPGVLYREVLERHGLAAPLRSFHFSYDSGSRKPSPVMLRTALEELGVAPQGTVMVGDRKASDVAAGRAAGLRTVWVRSEHSRGPSPDREIDSVAALPALLEG